VSPQDVLPFPEPAERPINPQQSFAFENAISALSQKLDRLHSGELVLCAQMKDLRVSAHAAATAFEMGAADSC
jgi:hypothetical protein